MQEILCASSTIDKLYSDGSVSIPEDGVLKHQEIAQNEPVILLCGSQSALCIRKLSDLVKISEPDVSLKARNAEQLAALWMLCDDTMPLLTMLGKAGTGKTLLAIAAGLKAVESGKARKLMVARPNVSLGDHHDYGHLPGTLEEKMSPLFGPVYDAFQVLKIDSKKIKYLVENGKLDFTPLAFIRGRSLNDCFVIVDESQNLDGNEIKTITTRIGTNCKMVLSGDTQQIDIKALRPREGNPQDGLSYLVQRTQNQPLIGHVILRKSERSPLCELLSELL